MSKQTQLNILFEDDDLLVVNKPAGLISMRTNTTTEVTLQDLVDEYVKTLPPVAASSWQKVLPAEFSAEFGSPEAIYEQRSGIAHRLDKETSGVMLVAKNPGVLVHLLAQFKARTTQKIYSCLTHGKFSVPVGEITESVQRDPIKRHQFAVRPEGKPAVTAYQVVKYFPHFNDETINKSEVSDLPRNFKRLTKAYQGFSLVECAPKTGRTHQIRVHMAFIKHPLVGDQVYVGKKRARLDAVWCPRQFLHAQSLQFTHPRSGEIMKIEAPMPTDLIKVLTHLHE